MSGWAAGRAPAWLSAWVEASLTALSTISCMIWRPYIFFTWATGTLPGRKPFRFMFGRISAIFASSSPERSAAGTVTE